MAYIVDTYNAVYAGSAMGGAVGELTVRKLCQWIVASPQRLGVTLVLDGRPKPDEPGENEFPEVTLVYSGTGIKADTVIAQMVARSANRKKIIVVTNDRAVALDARRQHASAISCETFLDMLVGGRRGGSAQKTPEKKPRGTLTPGESAHWMKEFGIIPPPPKPPKDDDDDIDMEKLMRGE